MTAKIIAVVNQKGGSGKTTVAMQAGGTLSLQNKKILIVDADEQNSALEWAAMASEGNPFPSRVINLAKAGMKIHQEIKKFIDDYEIIIVDCPPAADSPIAKSALLVSDVALVPFIPDGLNMLAAVKIRDTIDSAKVLNQNLNSLLVLNRVEPNTTLTRTVIDLLPQFNMNVANTSIHKRTHYAESVLSGATVHVFKSKAKEAIEEIEQFCNEILVFVGINQLEKKNG